ncbi:MAG: TlpA disulfide reductase family protein [Bacteroidota bacterium]
MIKKILFLFLVLPNLLLAQHTIKGEFMPKEQYTWCILYHVTPTQYLYVTDAKVVDGKFEMQIDSTRAPGVYKMVYGTPQEDKNFDLIYSGKEDIELSFSVENGVGFSASEENMLLAEYNTTMKGAMTQIQKEYRTEKPNEEHLSALFEMQRQLQHTAKTRSQGMLAHQFIKSSQPYIPMAFEPLEDYMENRKRDYFVPLDLTNPVLQQSSFILDKCLAFVEEFSTQEDPTSHEQMDAIIAHMNDMDLTYQKSLLNQLWGKLVVYDRVDAANYLAESYLIKLAETAGDKPLADYLQTFKNTSIGSKAPDFVWETEEDEKKEKQSLHEMEGAENYILVFWSSACSHCLKELPQLQKSVQNVSEDTFRVIAIGLEDEPYDWKNETYRYPEFTHVLGLGKWENAIGNSYSVSQTPTYFVLDKDKKIIAKPEQLKDLQEILAKK